MRGVWLRSTNTLPFLSGGALSLLLLAGCATVSPENQAIVQVVSVDLTAARDNFTAAGMPTEADCVQKVIDKIGVEQAQNLQVKGLVSLGSVAYIEYARLQGDKRSQIPESCYAIIGKVTTAVGKQGAAAFTGGVIGR